MEADLLSNIIGEKVASVSLHNPGMHSQYLQLGRYMNTYDNRIVADDRYISGSRMLFRGKNPFELIRNISRKPIQICYILCITLKCDMVIKRS